MATKTEIYITGNALADFDNTPIKLIQTLQKELPTVKFTIIDPNENLKPNNGNLFIIDTVINLNEVTIITDIDWIELSPSYSLHDLDLGFNLKLLKKLGKLRQAVIFGVPAEMDEHTAEQQLIQTLKDYFRSKTEPDT